MTQWKFWDWIAYGCLAVAALMEAIEAGLKNAPDFARQIPSLSSNTALAFTPLALLVASGVIFLVRQKGKDDSPHLTALRLSFSPGVLYADQLVRENIADFYSMRIGPNLGPALGMILFMVFESPVKQAQQIKVSFIGEQKLRYEINSFSFRYGIVWFEGSVDGVTIDISVQ